MIVAQLVDRYLSQFPDDVSTLTALKTQLDGEHVLNDRKNFDGHITGGAFILSPDRTRLLAVYHKLFHMVTDAWSICAWKLTT